MHICYVVSRGAEGDEHARSLEEVDSEITVTVVTGEGWTETDAVDCVLYHDAATSPAADELRSAWPSVPFVYVLEGAGGETDSDPAGGLERRDDWVSEELHAPTAVVSRIRRTVERASELAELRERATLFSSLIENTSDVVTVLDEHGTIRYESPSISEVLGYDPEELVGERIFDYIHPDDIGDAAAVFLDVITADDRRTGRVVFRFRRADGSWVYLEGVGRNLPVNGDVAAVVNTREFVITSRDITEMKRTTEELRSTRDQLQTILENTPAVVYMKDLDWRYLYVNPTFERLLGRSRDEILGKRTEEIHADANVEEIRAMDSEVLERAEPLEHLEELRFDGQRRVFFNVRVPLFDADGEPYAIYGIATEITELKQREESMQALAEVGTRLLECETTEAIGAVAVSAAKSILNQPITAVMTHDERSDVLRPIATTEEAVELLGDSPSIERGTGIAWRVFTTGEPFVSSDVTADPDAYNPDSAIESEIIVPLGEYGVLVAGSTTAREFDDKDREFAMILAAMIQGTMDRVDRERQLRTKNERLEEFAGVLAHDLRNPLTVAKGYTELAEETGELAYLEDVEQGIDRTASIVEGLLAIARTGQGVGEFEERRLERLARDAWTAVDTDGATLEIDGDRSVTADVSWLQQLFENGFRNSVEHGGSTVGVRVGALEDGFYVEDDGPGIDSEQRERLLGRTDAESDGRFGFRIIRDVVDAHGWELSITDAETGGAHLAITGVR
ncbi:PAS domain S-box protein [Natrononativus amylolyticus]|uniref:PAS domain S-box protein n=1 Tax=Natrononativus amylolyticus TaxID=2963434 RepID=UPI0020CD164B|nr:PAS domain S-box protein [Natrononativus amylolyticus]